MNIVNQSVLRDMNTRLIMRMIRDAAPVSRSELAQRSGLAPSTITNIIADLQNRQFIREVGQAVSNGGRRRTLLEINPDGGHLIGVELNSPTSHVGILNLANKLVHSFQFETTLNGGVKVYHQLVENIADALNWCREDGFNVLGIGIGSTGLVDPEPGTVESLSLGWERFRLRDRLKKIFDHSITIENEANAAAYGEYLYGVRSGPTQNMMYLAVGDGIGCGFIYNGNLYSGSSGMAGEIGHVTVQHHGPRCRCGKNGCLEAFASGPGMLAEYMRETGRTDYASASQLISVAEHGDITARGIVIEAGKAIGTTIGNLVNVLNLDTVILGGELLPDESMFFSAIQDSAFEVILPRLRHSVDIRLSSLHSLSAVMGAAAKGWRQIF